MQRDEATLLDIANAANLIVEFQRDLQQPPMSPRYLSNSNRCFPKILTRSRTWQSSPAIPLAAPRMPAGDELERLFLYAFAGDAVDPLMLCIST